MRRKIFAVLGEWNWLAGQAAIPRKACWRSSICGTNPVVSGAGNAMGPSASAATVGCFRTVTLRLWALNNTNHRK